MLGRARKEDTRLPGLVPSGKEIGDGLRIHGYALPQFCSRTISYGVSRHDKTSGSFFFTWRLCGAIKPAAGSLIMWVCSCPFNRYVYAYYLEIDGAHLERQALKPYPNNQR